jgi:hypothetical protein
MAKYSKAKVMILKQMEKSVFYSRNLKKCFYLINTEKKLMNVGTLTENTMPKECVTHVRYYNLIIHNFKPTIITMKKHIYKK